MYITISIITKNLFVFNSNTLQPGSSIHLNYLVQIQPSAVVDTIMNISLTLQYQRLSWNTPLNKTSKQSLPKIKSANVTGGANIYNSSVSSPNDHAVVTPGEDVMFVLTLTLPVATMKDFAMVVKSDGAQLVKGVVSQVGSGVSIGAGQLQGLGKKLHYGASDNYGDDNCHVLGSLCIGLPVVEDTHVI